MKRNVMTDKRRSEPLFGVSVMIPSRAAVYDAHGSLADYVETANDATLIVIQLEDEAAIHNIDALLQVEDTMSATPDRPTFRGGVGVQGSHVTSSSGLGLRGSRKHAL